VRVGIIGAGNFSNKVFSRLSSNTALTIVGGYDIPGVDGLESFCDLNDLLSLVDSVLVFDSITLRLEYWKVADL